ncbi:hypothetical protein ECHLIB_0437 [Ehrlichia chaffeensis str. Liberty]|uniref:Uncharacterized protein n=1 Tax=Ehrlichia chaffeensis (strain ATCC CRL-10679 / Arkansas) TaxID=205920 RepID=Q2GGD2_EHRCR|nr:hypothetical protein ECH_0696 [Ehrlichia chaffeensis str. Arkansas]AHX06498.1 hypothetical protein ECHLIB_0437 [Ehrlichia chaffeensis str. Liberty]AHX07897.1 hypothetical protein ECHOSC_0626 [Ehrlichia chaffeensis str. Osceola]
MYVKQFRIQEITAVLYYYDRSYTYKAIYISVMLPVLLIDHII